MVIPYSRDDQSREGVTDERLTSDVVWIGIPKGPQKTSNI